MEQYILNLRLLGPCPVLRHAFAHAKDGPITALVRAPSGREIEAHWSDLVDSPGKSTAYYGPTASNRIHRGSTEARQRARSRLKAYKRQKAKEAREARRG